MPNDADDVKTRLRECLDDLAVQLLLGQEGKQPAAELARLFRGAVTGIGEQARAAGFATIAQVASEVAEAVPAGGNVDLACPEDPLRQGLLRLQQAIEEENAVAAPPPPGRPAGKAQPAPLNLLAQSPELLSDFIVESREHLASVEKQLLTLEHDPSNPEALNAVFRGFHTIKGLAGFLELAAILEVAHEVETVLDLARNSELAITPAAIDVILESADYLKQSVELVESGLAGKSPRPAPDSAPLLWRLQQLRAEETAEEPAPEPPELLAQLSRTAGGAPPSAGVAFEDSAPQSAFAQQPAAAPQREANGKEQRKGAEALSVRVETAKLDFLMDMVGEMVIAQSLVRHNSALASLQDPRLLSNLSQLSRVTTEVQRCAMSMRMIPIGQLFHRTARVVRDLSRKTGKPVELVISGEDTELDKTIAEELSDPLLHMVRNALDHGVESPEERRASGKKPAAQIRLAAYHQSGQIVIEVSDDGRGLDREKILKKAQQNGLVAEDAQLSDHEVFNLVFEPGFSTAEQVTDVSGRGVGMDVVRKHVQNLRGRIEIQSRPGRGTTFLLKLPLTLAIIDGLVVGVGSQRYIMPIFAVREMLRPTAETMFTVQDREEMALVRGSLLPVVRLYRRFNVQPRSEDPCQALLIVAESAGRPFCLMVDDLVGKQEVVIKSLGDVLKNVPGIAGGAILGDGRVGLILDVDGLYRAKAKE